RRLRLPGKFSPKSESGSPSECGPILPTEALPTRPFLGLLIEKLPFLVLAGVMSAMTVKAHEQLRSVHSIAISLRVENAFVSYVRYLRNIVYPLDLTVLYLHPGKWPPF